MAGRRVTHVHVERDADADPIAGVVRADGGPGTRLAGWIEFTRTDEQSLETAAAIATPDPQPATRN